MTDANTPLRPKEEQFCHEYQVDLNGAAAARRAGYAKKSARITASKLLTKPNIQRRIAELGQERTEAVDATAEDVVRMLKDTYTEAKKAKQFGPAVRAVELLGKRHAMFTDRTIGDDQPTDPHEALRQLCGDDRELLELLWMRIFGEKYLEPDLVH